MQVVNVRQLKSNPSTALRSAKDDMVVVMNRDKPDALLIGFEQLAGAQLHGAMVQSVEETDVAPHKLYEPGNPDADDKGFVSMPGVNQVTEMVNIASALRAYEANVVAMNAAKTMALKALELGGSS